MTTKTASSETRGVPFSLDDPERRKQLLIGGIGAVTLVVAVALLFIFHPWRPSAPKLGGEAAKLGEYVSTPDFQKMSFEKREVYMKMMHSKKDQITKAYADGQMSLEDYQKSLLAAHLGKELDDMRKYFAKPVGAERLKYLDKLMAKKDTKEEAAAHDAAARQVKKEHETLKDAAAEKAEIATWPADIQAQYQEFHTAYEERKKSHKEEKAVTATSHTTPPIPQ